MKRCPTCNQTFDEEWLSFCTQDGTTLIEDSAASSGPPPTILATPSSASGAGPANANFSPGGSGAPLAQYGQPSSQPAWTPPPPPSIQSQNKSLAVASMVLGIISITVGWFCLGPIPAIAGIILGIVALSQIKKKPDYFGGQPFAWTGIITGGLMLLIYGGIMIFYALMVAIAASSK